MAKTDFDPRNSLIFFENDRKRPDKNDPDFTGTYTDADGKEHWLSIWPKTKRETGETFWTGSTRPKEARTEQRAAPARAGSLSMRRAPQGNPDIP
jgi:hypothetical protein